MSEYSIYGVWEYKKKDEKEICIAGYNGDETDIVVPKEIDGIAVTIIGVSAFTKKNITSIKFPSTLHSILSMAFAGCKQLISVELPDSIEFIGKSAFKECSSLVSINVPDSTTIARNTFKGCCKLVDEHGFSIIKDYLCGYYGGEEEIEIPEQVKYISESAFENNKNLKSVIFPETLSFICDKAFFNCTNLSSLEFQCYDTPRVGSDAFKNCPMLEDEDGFVIVEQTLCEYSGDKPNVIVPEGIEQIAPRAFSDKFELVSVSLPASLYEIEELSFVNCPKLSNMKMLPNTIINEDAFDNCPNLVDEDGFITIGKGTRKTVSDSE